MIYNTEFISDQKFKNVYDESMIEIFMTETSCFYDIISKRNSNILNESVLLEAEENRILKIIEKMKELFSKLFELIKEFFDSLLEKVDEISKRMIGPIIAKIKEKKNKKVKNESVIWEKNDDYKYYQYAESDIDKFSKTFEDACKHLPKNHSMENMYWIPDVYKNINASAEKIIHNIKVYFEKCILNVAQEKFDPSKMMEERNIDDYIYDNLPIGKNYTMSGRKLDLKLFTSKDYIIQHGVKIDTSNIMNYYKEIYTCAFNSISWKKSIKAQFEGAKDAIKLNEKVTTSMFKEQKVKDTGFLAKCAKMLYSELTSSCKNIFNVQMHFKKIALSLTYKIYMLSDIY